LQILPGLCGGKPHYSAYFMRSPYIQLLKYEAIKNYVGTK